MCLLNLYRDVIKLKFVPGLIISCYILNKIRYTAETVLIADAVSRLKEPTSE